MRKTLLVYKIDNRLLKDFHLKKSEKRVYYCQFAKENTPKTKRSKPRVRKKPVNLVKLKETEGLSWSDPSENPKFHVIKKIVSFAYVPHCLYLSICSADFLCLLHRIPNVSQESVCILFQRTYCLPTLLLSLLYSCSGFTIRINSLSIVWENMASSKNYTDASFLLPQKWPFLAAITLLFAELMGVLCILTSSSLFLGLNKYISAFLWCEGVYTLSFGLWKLISRSRH